MARPMWSRSGLWSGPHVQLMILLSALLASLTGLVAGERPVERATVEVSAVVAVVQASAAVSQPGVRPAHRVPRLAETAQDAAPSLWRSPVRSARALLPVKQSWLI